MQNHLPKISIIIATYNSSETIERCINSIVKQSYKNFEIFIKDGASKDNTISLIESFHLNIGYIQSGPDCGVYDAWNYCMPHVRGEWYTFLGSDDYYEDEFVLERIAKSLDIAMSNGMLIAYGRNRIIDKYGITKCFLGRDWRLVKSRIMKEMTIRHPGCFYHKSLLINQPQFDVKFRIAGDHFYTLLCLQESEPYFYNFVAVVHQLGGISTSVRGIDTVLKETKIIQDHFGVARRKRLGLLLVKRYILKISLTILGSKLTNLIFVK